MNKVLDSRNRRVLSACQTLIRLTLLSSTNETLNLDDLFHVLPVELLLLGVLLANNQTTCKCLKLCDSLVVLLELSELYTDIHAE
jgi:hypothetical protein